MQVCNGAQNLSADTILRPLQISHSVCTQLVIVKLSPYKDVVQLFLVQTSAYLFVRQGFNEFVIDKGCCLESETTGGNMTGREIKRNMNGATDRKKI